MPQNKKFLAQRQREERQKKIIIYTTIAILVIVIGLIAYGVVERYLLRPNTPVIELESQVITADQFEQQARWVRRNLIIEIDQILMTVQQLGGSPEIYSYFEQQLLQSTTKLSQPLLVGQEVLQNLTDEIILQVEAEKLGIVVDDQLIDREIEEAFGFYANGTPTPQATMDTGQGAAAPTATPQAAGDDQGPDPTATPLLVPTEYTRELFQENYDNFLVSVKDSGIKEQTLRDIVRFSVIRERVYEMVTADVEQTQEQVWIRHILVEDQATAQEVADKLADGADFAQLAAEYSLDESNKDSGGDLGWFGRGRMVAPFEDAAFALEVGQVSEPIETDFGWHILESLGKENRPVDSATYQQLQSQAFNDWLEAKRTEYQPVVNENWVKFIPTEPTLPAEYISYIQSLTMERPQLPTDIPQPTADTQE